MPVAALSNSSSTRLAGVRRAAQRRRRRGATAAAVLFGADRIGLRALVEPLLELQDGACFSCGQRGGGWEADHFIVSLRSTLNLTAQGSRWPDNRLDNVVRAHERCNNDKRAALTGLRHVEQWWRRFDPASRTAGALGRIAVKTEWPRRPVATRSAARALYLRQPDATVLWVGGPGRVETLYQRRLYALMRSDAPGLAAEERADFDA